MSTPAQPAGVTLENFRSLSLPEQAALLFAEGTLLAHRWEGYQAVGLYQIEDFFCELSYDTTTYALRGTRAVTCLADLVSEMGLPLSGSSEQEQATGPDLFPPTVGPGYEA